MAKKNAKKSRPAPRRGAVGPAGRTAAASEQTAAAPAAKPAVRRPTVDFVARPFEGLGGEADWVALREIIPAGTASVRTTAEHGSAAVTIVSLLPDLLPALRREDGELLVAMQTVGSSGDASRDVAAALLLGLDLEPGAGLTTFDLPGPGPRLQDVLEPGDLTATAHDSFSYWLGEGEHDEDLERALESANDMIVETVEVPVPAVAGAGSDSGADASDLGTAYWCRMNGKEFLRWIVPAPEELTLDALARLHARRVSALEEGTRLIGAFRTCGVLVPVWELARGTEADELAGPVAELAERLAPALATSDPLTAEERRARAGLVSRQVNLR